MFNTIRQMGVDYYNSLPKAIVSTIGASVILSSGLTVLLCRRSQGVVDFNQSLMAAAVAATASVIHAVTTPLFKFIFGSLHGTWPVELIKMGFITLITSFLIQAVSSGGSSTKGVLYTAVSINLIASLLSSKFQSNENSVYVYLNV